MHEEATVCIKLYPLENIISLDPYGFHSIFFLYKNEFMSIATVHEKNTSIPQIWTNLSKRKRELKR